MSNHDDRRRSRARARVLLFLVIATALLTLGVCTYTLIDRPGRATLTPAGANYNPGSSGAVTKPPS